jgi:hypothetical protein
MIPIQIGTAAVEILVEDNRKLENVSGRLDEIQSDLHIANKVSVCDRMSTYLCFTCKPSKSGSKRTYPAWSSGLVVF